MDREQLVAELNLKCPNGAFAIENWVLDFILSHTEELKAKAYKQGYKDADKAIACEYRDPNGTIWEWCEKVQKENSRLNALVDSVEKPLMDGIEWSKKFTRNPAVDHWKKLYNAIDDALAKIAEFKEVEK